MNTKKLDTLRDQITALVDERAEVENAPVPREEVVACIAALMDAPYSGTLHKGRIDLDPNPTGLCDGSFSSSGLLEMLERPGVLRALFPDALSKYLLSIYDKELDGATPGLPTAERRARLAELDAQIFKLETDEERTIEALEADGVDGQRRPDADPRAALDIGAPSEAA